MVLALGFVFFLDGFSIGAYVFRNNAFVCKNRSNELSTLPSLSLSTVCQSMLWRSCRNTLGSNRSNYDTNYLPEILVLFSLLDIKGIELRDQMSLKYFLRLIRFMY